MSQPGGRSEASARLGKVTIDLDALPVEPASRPRLGTRRFRWTLVGVATTVVVAAAVAVVLGGSPPPAVAPPEFEGQLRWVASLVDARPRGTLAGDASFTRELADRVEQAMPASGEALFANDGGRPRPLHAMVLFATDIDDYRVALLSLRNPELLEARARYALTYLLWLYGPRGATPEALAQTVTLGDQDDDVAGYRLDSAAPVTSMLVGDSRNPIWVLLAPPECEVATAPAADLTDWTPDATGYLVRRPRADGPQYWRATCEGAVREQGPVPRPALDERDLDRLMDTAVGRPDREQLYFQASHMTLLYGSEMLTPGRVIWSGDVALSPTAVELDTSFALVRVGDGVTETVDVPVETTVTVLTAPRARGGWLGSVATVVRAGPDRVWHIDDTTFAAPDNPHGLIAVHLDRWQRQVLVLVQSPEVTTVQLVDGDGSVLDESTVDERPVMLAPDRSSRPRGGMYVAALDATGVTLTTTELADVNPQADHTSAWGA